MSKSSHLVTTMLPSGKLTFEIMTPTDMTGLPKELHAHIDSYNQDIFWKPGTTHTSLYERKRIQMCIPFPYSYRLYIGIIWELPTDENTQVIQVI